MAENDGKVFSSAHHSKNSGTPLSPCEYARYFNIALLNPTVSNTSFSKISPFLIRKALISVLGEVTSVRKLRSGDLLVQVSSEKQATTLSTCKSICSFSVNVTPHKTLNTSRGVISQSEFIDDTEEMIVDELRDQHVIAVRRIKVRRNGQLVPTKHLILTFATPKLPSEVKLAWYNCPVRPYVPNPLRCFQCQRFGHSKASCRSTPICARCSGCGHDDTSCELPPLCINCKGDHAAYSRNCPKWSQEKEIQTIKVMQNLTFNEARRMVTARTPRPGVSYSAAVKATYCSVSTQTDTPFALTSTKQPTFHFGASKPNVSNQATSSRSSTSTNSPPSKAAKLDQYDKFPKKQQRIDIKPQPIRQRPGQTKKIRSTSSMPIQLLEFYKILKRTMSIYLSEDEESILDCPPANQEIMQISQSTT
ncbi:uncharacterized protein [Parasteatoda tepidariorum]|uniref:uncharacterized protein n=1 Tax=Parasteatoda tepidariorum TaxID=114398 RepID=UPI001C71AAAA|nr:uncharacterized protein LOC107453284 [Parasteatoda tepidariorum]